MGLLDGDSWSDRYARLALPILVQWIEEAVVSGAAHQLFTYKQLASILNIHHRTIHWALGAIGHAIEQLDKTTIKQWNAPIPPIEVIVCGKHSKIPGDGGLSFLSRYLGIPLQEVNRMPEAAKRELVWRVHEQIYCFPHWREVLGFFDLKPSVVRLPALSTTLEKIRSHVVADAGESYEHKRLKQYVCDNPTVIGISIEIAYRKTEEIVLSGDRLDVLLKSARSWFCIEVKPGNSPESEVIRGLFQCTKYKAVLTAQQVYERMQTGSVSLLETIDVRLVLGGPFPNHLEPLRRMLGINVFSNIKVPKAFGVNA